VAAPLLGIVIREVLENVLVAAEAALLSSSATPLVKSMASAISDSKRITLLKTGCVTGFAPSYRPAHPVKTNERQR
jgi:hypothetical protein